MALRGPVADQRIETSTVDARNAPARPEILRLTEVCAGHRRVSAGPVDTASAVHRSPEMPSWVRSVTKNVERAAIAAWRASRGAPKLGCRVTPAERGTPHANALAGPTGRRDRRAVGAPRRRDRAPPRSHPRVRRP